MRGLPAHPTRGRRLALILQTLLALGLVATAAVAATQRDAGTNQAVSFYRR